ncbi:hypothetical protein Patl1_19236 [Pistacia atlantica]|uniref:Uncharacterized protein n=1 Tax=Pistacia atlantica TaxID=434234 RepID=A0ACC1BZV1_9ROSI|nr:hypothetical protein Patl1_19236 [Pistacia atlantica]
MKTATDCHMRKVDNFSILVNESYRSKIFGIYKWKVRLFPKGDGEAKGNNISINLSYSSG